MDLDSSTKKNVLIGILIVILAFSIGMNLYDNTHTKPVLQERIDYMSAEAFGQWLEEMRSIRSIFQLAVTPSDLKQALNYSSAAVGFTSILDWTIEIARPSDFSDHLYSHLGGATFALDTFVSSVITSTVNMTQRLDNNTQLRISNLTVTIGNLISSVGTVEDGIDPVRQLEAKNVLTEVINYCMQIRRVSFGGS